VPPQESSRRARGHSRGRPWGEGGTPKGDPGPGKFRGLGKIRISRKFEKFQKILAGSIKFSPRKEFSNFSRNFPQTRNLSVVRVFVMYLHMFSFLLRVDTFPRTPLEKVGKTKSVQRLAGRCTLARQNCPARAGQNWARQSRTFGETPPFTGRFAPANLGKQLNTLDYGTPPCSRHKTAREEQGKKP